MEEQIIRTKKTGGVSKKLIAIIVVAILVIGGGVAAYIASNISDKQKYFSAEKNSIDFLNDRVEDRYAAELKWQEQTEKNPTETAIGLSAEFNDPFGNEDTEMISQIVNSSSFNITTSHDLEKKILSADIEANVSEFEIGDINFYLTGETLIVNLPFLDEALQINSEDIGPMLHEMDPDTFSGEEDIDFNTFFDAASGGLNEEDIEYFQKEYLTFIYKELPDTAFTSKDETIDVLGESVKTEKINMDLTEAEFKELVVTVLNKLQNDDRLKELIREQMNAQLFNIDALTEEMSGEVDQMLVDLDEGIETAKAEIEDVEIPDGFTSTIWVKDNLIVKRDISVTAGPTPDDLVTLTINGEQSLEKENQSFAYDLGFSSAYDEGALTITGDLESKDGAVNDSIKLLVAGNEIAYNSEESLEKGTRDFNRVFSVDGEDMPGGSFIWSGSSTYDNDKMNSENNFSLDVPEFGPDVFTLLVAIDAKTIKEVEAPSNENIKDIGSMTPEEVENYVETEAAAQFQQWLMGLMLSGGNLDF